jgi:hypothetical protein
MGEVSTIGLLFDLNAAANSVRKKHSSATIIAHVKRFCQAFKLDEVFDTHTGRSRPLVRCALPTS